MKKSGNTVPWSYSMIICLNFLYNSKFLLKAALLWLNSFYRTGRRTEFSQLFVNTEEIDISLSISVNNKNLSRQQW